MALGVQLSVRNAAAFWAAVARSRGHELIQRPGLLTVVGDEAAGMRVLLLHPKLDNDARDFVEELVSGRPELPVVIEDQFARSAFSDLGLTPKALPVMVRDDPEPPPGTPSNSVAVTTVETVAQLRATETIVVHGFDLPRMQPYRAGQAFPDDLLWYPGVRLFLAERDGLAAGACLTVDEGTCGGIYWVTTLPDHRTQGVGRSVMTAALAHLAPSPVSLTATAAGEPLYESLGFRVVGQANWWARTSAASLSE
jgi:ribosomal protein S18 acetylase RimI-like enzyme